jgi:hypothetical protein
MSASPTGPAPSAMPPSPRPCSTDSCTTPPSSVSTAPPTGCGPTSAPRTPCAPLPGTGPATARVWEAARHLTRARAGRRARLSHLLDHLHPRRSAAPLLLRPLPQDRPPTTASRTGSFDRRPRTGVHTGADRRPRLPALRRRGQRRRPAHHPRSPPTRRPRPRRHRATTNLDHPRRGDITVISHLGKMI